MKTARKKTKKTSVVVLKHPLFIATIATIVVFYILVFAVYPNKGLFTDLPSETATYAAPQNTLTTIAKIEAEDFSTYSLSGGLQVIDDQSASMGKAMMFSINTSATGSINLPSSSSKLVVRAKGDRCKGNPKMQISIGDTVVFEKNIPATTWNDYQANVSIPPGSHNLAISFTNDLIAGSCDRGLKVDSLLFQ